MIRQWGATVLVVGLMASTAAAQDAKTVIASASKAMGADNLNSITFYGSGANFGLGQSNNANGQWPRTNVNDYVRSIDFTQPVSRMAARMKDHPGRANITSPISMSPTYATRMETSSQRCFTTSIPPRTKPSRQWPMLAAR